MKEADLVVINGLVARLKRVEAQYLRTRSVKRGDELFIEADRIRWRLVQEFNLETLPLDGKAGPDGKDTA